MESREPVHSCCSSAEIARAFTPAQCCSGHCGGACCWWCTSTLCLMIEPDCELTKAGQLTPAPSLRRNRNDTRWLSGRPPPPPATDMGAQRWGPCGPGTPLRDRSGGEMACQRRYKCVWHWRPVWRGWVSVEAADDFARSESALGGGDRAAGWAKGNGGCCAGPIAGSVGACPVWAACGCLLA